MSYKSIHSNNWILYIFILLFFSTGTRADNELIKLANNQTYQTYAKNIYSKLNLDNTHQLNYDIFELAVKGFLNLKSAHKLNTDRDILSICDYSLSANVPRLWVIDLDSKTILLNDYVAHGQGTGEEFAQSFSNKENSHQSSLGFFVTGNTYMGEHGLSMHLHGQDKGFNDAAYQRSIVLHGASYVCAKFIQDNKRLGRSWGCPAVNNEISAKVIEWTKQGTCMFLYYPDQQYLAQSYWLNKNINPIFNPLSDPEFFNNQQASVNDSTDILLNSF